MVSNFVLISHLTKIKICVILICKGEKMQTTMTISAEDSVLKRAKEKAQQEHKTLTGLFNEWLVQYVKDTGKQTAKEYDAFMERVKYAAPGRSFSRDEMNAR